MLFRSEENVRIQSYVADVFRTKDKAGVDKEYPYASVTLIDAAGTVHERVSIAITPELDWVSKNVPIESAEIVVDVFTKEQRNEQTGARFKVLKMKIVDVTA